MTSFSFPRRIEKLGHDGIQFVAQSLLRTKEGLVIEELHFLNAGRQESRPHDDLHLFDNQYAVPGKKWPLPNVRRVCRWAVVANSRLICIPNKDLDPHVSYSGFAVHLERVFGVKLYPNKLNIVSFENSTVLDLGLTPPDPYQHHPTVLAVSPDLLTVAVARGGRVVVADLDI